MGARDLAALLSAALVRYGRDWDATNVGEPEGPSLLQWSNALRPIGEEGIRLADAHKLARISRRAMRSMLQSPWFAIEAGESRGSQIVKLTASGRLALEAGRKRHAVVEEDWRQRFGDAAIDRLRRALESSVGQLPLELPHHPNPYGPADGSMAGGGGASKAKPGPPRIPPHGADWPVVLRDGVGEVRDLPVSALLSQAFVAFALDYEDETNPSHSGIGTELTAMLDLITTQGVSVERVPRTRAWPDWFVDHDIASLEPDPSRPRKKVLRLTARGEALKAKAASCLAATEREWRTRCGIDAIDELRAALAPVAQPHEGAPEHLLLAFVGGHGFVLVR